MTKFKKGQITRGNAYLAKNTLPVAVMLRSFSLLPLLRYLLPLATLNRHLTRDTNGTFLLLPH